MPMCSTLRLRLLAVREILCRICMAVICGITSTMVVQMRVSADGLFRLTIPKISMKGWITAC